MTTKEYFAQDKYFSESSQEFVVISMMPYSHAFYAFRKLLQLHTEEFFSSKLYYAFQRHLCPSAWVLKDQLQKHGVASITPIGISEGAARKRLHQAGHILGEEIKTHKEGKWIEGKIEIPNVTIRVKGKTIVEG